MSIRPRRKFSDFQKTKAVLAHVQDGVPVSQVCGNLGIHPNQYNEWQKQAFYSFSSRFFQRRYSAGTQ
jgi:transposase-like protein